MADATERFEALARELLDLESGAEVAGAVRIGERVIEAVFGGSFEAFSSRNGHKDASIEGLARACGRHPDWVSLRVRLSEQYPRYDAPFRDQVNLSVHAVLLRLPEIERNRFLRRAAIEALTVRELTRIAFPGEIPDPSAPQTQAQRLLARRDTIMAEAERAAGKPDRATEVVKGWEDVIAMAKAAIKVAKSTPKPPKRKSKQATGTP